jgi:hypothetical protein
MFLRLLEEWGGEGKLSPREIGEKVRHNSKSSHPPPIHFSIDPC